MGTGSASGSASVSGVGTSSSSNPTNVISRLIPGWGQVNPTGRRQCLIPGQGYFNETAPEGSAGLSEGTSLASGVGASIAAGTGESSGSSSASGVSFTGSGAVGSAAGSATVTGAGSYSVPNFASYFSPDELFTHIDLLQRVTVAGAGSATGAANVAGTGMSLVTATGSAEGSSEATAEGSTSGATEIVIHGNPIALYSFIRPVGYDAATDPVPLRIERVSDGAQTDIGYAASGLIDIDAANAFAPGGWYFHTLRDLRGGYHATVPAGVSKPRYMGNSIHGVPTWSFNGPVVNEALANYSVPITNIRNHTVFAIVRANQGGVYELGLPTRRNTLNGSVSTGLNWTGVQGQSLISSPQVLLATGNGASPRVLKQNHIVTTASAQASNAATGLSLGGTINLTTRGTADYAVFALYDETLDGTTQENQRDAGFTTVPAIPRECRDVIVVIGDSLVQGNSRPTDMSVESLWFNILMKNTSRPFTWVNHGWGGRTLLELAAIAAGIMSTTYDPAGTITIIPAAGSNDMAFGATATTAYSRLLDLIAQCRTVVGSGSNVIFHPIDVIPRKAIFSGGVTAASFETERQAFNALVAAGSGVDFNSYSSPGTDPFIGDPANCNTTNFPDLVHLSASAYAVVEAVINASTLYFRA